MNTIDEGLWPDIVKRGTTGDVRKEDEFDEKQVNQVKYWLKNFEEHFFFFDEYDNTLKGCEECLRKNYYNTTLKLDDVISHIGRNWNKGENYESYVNDMITKNEEMLKKYNFKRKPNESIGDTLDDFWGDLSDGEKYDLLSDSGYEVEKSTWDYESTSCDDCWNELDWEEKISIYVDCNNDMNECDVVSPNGGLVFGDIQGMGPITLPGECGERGSGDLPMPSGRVYQQVAPFGTFAKMKKNKKKKKKFRKEDEPCVHSPNKPVYNYVDDYRDYVDRTYDKMK